MTILKQMNTLLSSKRLTCSFFIKGQIAKWMVFPGWLCSHEQGALRAKVSRSATAAAMMFCGGQDKFRG